MHHGIQDYQVVAREEVTLLYQRERVRLELHNSIPWLPLVTDQNTFSAMMLWSVA